MNGIEWMNQDEVQTTPFTTSYILYHKSRITQGWAFTHSSPLVNTSFFQMGTVFLIVSMM
jgi:hypothetical protein